MSLSHYRKSCLHKPLWALRQSDLSASPFPSPPTQTLDMKPPVAYNTLMSSTGQPSEAHQVGVTNAQANNPDPAIANLTRRMNAEFHAARFAEAGRIAF